MFNHNKEKKPIWPKTILTVAGVGILVTSSFFGGVIFAGSNSGVAYAGTNIARNRNEASQTSQSFDQRLFWQVWDTLKNNYVDQDNLTESQMFYGALKGIAESTGDPYTIFMTPEDTKEFEEDMSGSFEGIGAEIGLKNEIITVVAPLDGMPAQQAGLKAGDKIINVDDQSTAGWTVTEAVKKIRGPKDSYVNLSILREGTAKQLEFKIKRGLIQIKSVKTEWKGDNLVVSVSSFNDDTESLFAQAVDEAVAKKAKGIVLDLRNNPGGYLNTAISMSGYWIDGQVVVSEKYANGEKQDHHSTGEAKLAGLPTVVLVNQGSASASEIVAGALQDYGVAKIIGEKTFGKGSVQSLQSFSDGSSLKVTAAKWLTPKGRSINKAGIEPDIKVENSADDVAKKRDTVMNKALEILKTQK